MNTVCAVLVNYRCAGDTAAAAASVLADRPDIELVVVDNSDDAGELSQLRLRLPAAARVLVAPGNLGFGAGCNLAVAASTAAFIWLVNPDARVTPGCLNQLLNALKADETLAAVAPRQHLDRDRAWQLPPSELPTALGWWARAKAHGSARDWARYTLAVRAEAVRLWTAPVGRILRQRALSGAALLVRRSSLRPGESLFDPRYFMYYEDSDFCLRMRQRNLGLAVVTGAEVVHLWQMAPHKVGLMSDASPTYFKRHFDGNPWLEKARRLAGQPAAIPSFRHVPRGEAVEAPASLAEEWLLELSPSPLLSPAVAMRGAGATIGWPRRALAAFMDAPVYGRIGPCRTAFDKYECALLSFNADTDDSRV